MKRKLRTLRNLATYAPHRVYALILVVMAVLIPSIAIFAYGPDRPTFTAENPATYVTFNSITDSPGYGDERNFVLAKDADSTTDGGFTDTVNVTPGKEYIVRMLVHNNAAANLNLVATNTRVSANVPTTTGTQVQIDGFVSADNASPQKVWDDVVLKSDQNFNVAYVPGSAAYYNMPNLSRKFTLPDSIVTSTGAQVGYDAMDGNLPGCNLYSGIATFLVKVQGEAQPNFTVTKQVRKDVPGQTGNWQKSINASPGDKVDYLIDYQNTGQTQQNNVVAKDSLPADVAYDPGTTKYFNATNPAPNGKSATDDLTTGTGINLGNYTPNSDALITFTGTIGKNDSLPQCGNNDLRNTATVETDNGSKQDYADVIVNKNCGSQASYSCDALQATKISDLQYSYNVKLSSANGATPGDVMIDFGDGQNATRDLSSLPVTHTYAAAGQYSVKATASFSVNGQTVSGITSDACQTAVNTASTTPPATPTTPGSLPSTGPVQVFAGILGASAFGLGIQQWIASRRAVAEAFNIQK